MGGECVTCGREYSNLHNHYNVSYPDHKPDDWPECPSCGERYNGLGTHWRSSECDYPDLTQRQYDIVVGLVMGDGTVNQGRKNPHIKCNMIAKGYLEYLDDIFGILSTGVRLKKTAKEGAKLNRQTGFSPNADSKDYSDVFVMKTRNLPQLKEFADWYGDDRKVWPEDINLTPTVLKHWYVGDGCYVNEGGSEYISISLSNEADNKEKVTSYFESVGLPQPNNWDISERKDGSQKCDAVWRHDRAHDLLEYMLEDGYGIPPAFEYKWADQYVSR